MSEEDAKKQASLIEKELEEREEAIVGNLTMIADSLQAIALYFIRKGTDEGIWKPTDTISEILTRIEDEGEDDENDDDD